MRWYHQPLDSRRKRHLLGTEYRRLNTVNGRGQPVQETYGNGMVLLPQYTSQTGQVTELKYMLGSGELRRLNYPYDVFGNLRRQTLNSGQTQEDFACDSLQRLVSSIRSGAASGTTTYAYDVVGNFTSKSDFSTTAANAYTYTGGSCGGGPNAVKSIALAAGGTRTYCYDANGNLTSDNAGLSIRYDHMNMAVQASRGSQTDTFRYGSDGKRTRSWGADGSRVYLPGYEHRTDTGETKVYVGDYAVITRTGTTRKVDYLLKDRLGSVDAVANATGSITEARGYDPFGKPRDGTWADRTPATLTSRLTTPKGFTQHEHLDAIELIHMNGRVFEYHMGRFTGVDPFIQFPLNSQSLNPYSYILNNPLSGTDPTGYKAKYQDPRNSICGNRRCRQTIGGGSAGGRDREANPFNAERRVIRADQYHGSASNGASDGQQLHGRPLLATPEQLERMHRPGFVGKEAGRINWASLSNDGDDSPDATGVDADTHIENRLDIVVRRPDGRPKFVGSRTVTEEQNDGDRASAARMRWGRLYLQGGKSIRASVPENDKNFAWTTNCHGFSIGFGAVWIQDEDMQEFLRDPKILVPVNAPEVGDLVVYREDGNVVHSAIYAGNGRVLMASGTDVYQTADHRDTKVTVQTVKGGWPMADTIEYWRKEE